MHNLAAQSYAEKDWWSQSMTLGPGFYESEGYRIRVRYTAEKRTRKDGQVLPVITFAEGTTVRNLNFDTYDGTFVARQTLFDSCHLSLSLDSVFSATDSVFRDSKHFKIGGWYVRRWTVKLDFDNCVFYKYSISTKDRIDTTNYGIKIVNSTFYDSTLPEIWYKEDLNEELGSGWRTVKNCRFVNCRIPYSFLICTENCLFDHCTFSNEASEKRWEFEVNLPVSKTIFILNQRGSSRLGIKNFTVTGEAPPSKSDFGSKIRHRYDGKQLHVEADTYPDPESQIATPIGTRFVEFPFEAHKSGYLDELEPSTPKSRPEPTPPPKPEPDPKPEEAPETGLTKVTVSGTAGSRQIELNQNRSQLMGLLVMPLGGSKYAGKASRMNLIALPTDSKSPANLTFNQEVGSSMGRALETVAKFMQLEHGGWPRGYDMEISFEDKYSSKDGPSAAVACALLLDSAITGKKLDNGFAVTGDLNVDGRVQPIGAVAAKIRGATHKECHIVAIPKQNAKSATDIILSDGVMPLTEIQVFTIKNLKEARQLAVEEKSENIRKSLELFSDVQRVLKARPEQALHLLKNPNVQQRLIKIVKLTPNHLSARLLTLQGRDMLPEHLSLPGSLDTIDLWASALLDALGEKPENYGALDQDGMRAALARLRSSRNILDPRTRPYLDSIELFGDLLYDYQKTRPKDSARVKRLQGISAAADRARHEYEKLKSDPSVVEELIQ